MSVEVYKRRHLLHAAQRKIHKRKNLNTKDCRCLMILHLFYNDSWKEIREYLQNLEEYKFDLIITATTNIIHNETIKQVLEDYPKAKIIWCENKGFDILPFFVALKDVNLDSYDIVFKVHSKSTKRPYIYIYEQLFFRRDWFVSLFDGILAADNVHKTIDLLYNNDNIGLVATENLIVEDPKHKQQLIIKTAELNGYHIDPGYHFVAGTCFAVKAECLKSLQLEHFEKQNFETIPSSRGMSFAHFLERYLCVSIEQQGYKLRGNPINSVRKRLFYQPIEKVLSNYSSERLLDEPIDLDAEWFYWKMDNKLVVWKYDDVKFCDLQYWNGQKTISVMDGAPYKYLNGDVEGYKQYCDRHFRANLPLMSRERFDSLIESVESNGFDPKKITIVDENNLILDGQHRACILAKKYGPEVRIHVLRITTLRNHIKKQIPRPIMQIYRKIKYKSSE